MTETERRRLFTQGLKAGRERNYAKAVKVFSQLADGDDPRPLLLLGRSYHGLGDYVHAVQLFQTGLRLHGPSPELHFFLGRSWLAAGSPARAVAWLDKAREKGFGGIQTLGLLGTALLKGKNPARAVTVLQTAVENAPEHRGIYIAYLNALYVRALQLFHAGETETSCQMLRFLLSSGAESGAIHLYLASALRELGRFEESLPHLEAALHESPDDPVLISQTVEALFRSGRREEGRTLLESHKDLLPGVTTLSSELVEDLLPFQHLNQGKLRRAIYFALKVLKRRPDAAEMSLVLGEAYRRLDHLPKAEAHFERARKALRSSPEAEYGLLLVHWQAGNFEEAFRDAQRLQKTSPRDPTVEYYLVLLKCRLNKPALENIEALRKLIPKKDPDPFLFAALAEEYRKEGLEDLALPWIRRALTLDPENKVAIEALAAVLPRLDVPEWKPAFAQYLALRPHDEEILHTYVRRLLDVKDWTEAQKRLLDWMALGHRNVGSLRTLAFVHRMRGNFSDSLLVYRELLHADPKDPEYLSGVILCLYKTDRKEFALEFARRAAAAVPPNVRFSYQVGLVAEACDDRDQAERSFRKAIEIDAGHWPSYLKLAELFARSGDETSAERYRKHAESLNSKSQPLARNQRSSIIK